MKFTNDERTQYGADEHRTYGYCAKCGQAKEENRNYVHEECRAPATPGAFHHCAVCAEPWESEDRTYVCMDCLVVSD